MAKKGCLKKGCRRPRYGMADGFCNQHHFEAVKEAADGTKGTSIAAWETVWEKVVADEHYYVQRTTDLNEARAALYVACGGAFDDAGADFAATHFGDKRPKYFYRTSNSGVFADEQEALAFEKEYMEEDGTVAVIVPPGAVRKPKKAKGAKA